MNELPLEIQFSTTQYLNTLNNSSLEDIRKELIAKSTELIVLQSLAAHEGKYFDCVVKPEHFLSTESQFRIAANSKECNKASKEQALQLIQYLACSIYAHQKTLQSIRKIGS